jgi:hypothetical protein
MEFKLIHVPSGQSIKKWSLPKDLEENVVNQFDVKPRLNHPLMLKDSSLILKFTQKNVLLSLSKDNKMNWINRNLTFHHSTELQDDSTIWIPSIEENSNYIKIKEFRNDAICAFDPRNGKIKFMKSVADILVENGYENLIKLGYEDDAIHLNDIQPALTTSKYWQKGDLLLSLRNRNTIALYRPSTNKIIWLKNGPWIAQHDCDFVDEKTIMVFGNDVLRQKNDTLINGHNDIYFYDFEKNKISKPYTKVMKEAGIKTKAEGRCDLLSNGDLFIEETNNGKIYIINKDGVKMIFTERSDKNHIKMFDWTRPILN